jgi:hypothetical protein
VEEAKRLTLSNLLLADQKHNTLMAFPQHEAIIGFTLAAQANEKRMVKRRFNTEDEAVAAYRRGELKLTDTVEIAHAKTAAEDVEEGDYTWDGGPVCADDAEFCPAAHVVGGDEDEDADDTT